MPKQNVVIGFLGTQLDSAKTSKREKSRWDSWRPTVGLCQHEDFLIDRYELLYDSRYESLAEEVMADMRQVSPETEVIGRVLGIQRPWDFEDVYGNLYDYLQQLRCDISECEYYAHITTGTHVAQICLFILTESGHLPGKLIQTAPPRGRSIGAGRGAKTVIDLDLSKYDRLATRFSREQEEAQDLLKSGIATRNAAFNALIEQIEIVALRSRAPILITGATGAGKSRLASQIYSLRSDRAGVEGDFVEVNCATLRGDGAMSALFGHKKGSFTGAQADRAGLLREAHGGVLFLDEIGELGLDEQAMLLRALEEGKWLPYGSDKPVKSRFQLITGTNRGLREVVVKGQFREDLLARINTWTFTLPGLAERREDIRPNLEYELSNLERDTGRVVQFNKEAYGMFLKFAEHPASAWRGNFRDLNAAVTRMSTMAPRGRIREQEVEAEIARLEYSWQRGKKDDINERELDEVLGAVLSEEARAEIDPFDQPQLAYVIEVCRSSRSLSDAGRVLYAVSREKRRVKNDGDRLRKYLAKFGLRFEDL